MHFKLSIVFLTITLMYSVRSSEGKGYNTEEEQSKLNIDAAAKRVKALSNTARLLEIQLEEETSLITDVKDHLKEVNVQRCKLDEFFKDIDVKLDNIKTNNDNVTVELHNFADDCSSDENNEQLEAQLKGKLDEFDKLGARLQSLEAILNISTTQYQDANSQLTNMLTEINNQLNQHQEKMEKIEAAVIEVQNVSADISILKAKQKSECNRKKCISSKILNMKKYIANKQDN